MKVALVNYEYPEATTNCGGGGRVTKLLYNELKDTGHSATVFTDNTDGHYATFPIRQYSSLKHKLRQWKPDVVHGHFSLPSSLPLPRIVDEETPLVVSCMGADVYDPTRFSWMRPVANVLNWYVFSHADAVTTPSRDLDQRLSATNTTIIPHGIQTDNWQWRRRRIPSDNPIKIATVARLVERKNLMAAVDAVAELHNRGIDVQHTIIGTGPLQNQLETLDYDWLSVPGYVPDLESALADQHLFFLPSHHEAFGIVFLEALAAGLPVVTSATGGQADIVTPSVGYTYRAESSSAYADVLERAISQYDALQAETEGYVERNYSAERMTQRYCNLYHDLTGQN